MTGVFLGLALAAIAAFQRYSVSYGYEGLSKQEAWSQAKRVFVLVLAAVTLGVTVAYGILK